MFYIAPSGIRSCLLHCWVAPACMTPPHCTLSGTKMLIPCFTEIGVAFCSGGMSRLSPCPLHSSPRLPCLADLFVPVRRRLLPDRRPPALLRSRHARHGQHPIPHRPYHNHRPTKNSPFFCTAAEAQRHGRVLGRDHPYSIAVAIHRVFS